MDCCSKWKCVTASWSAVFSSLFFWGLLIMGVGCHSMCCKHCNCDENCSCNK